MNKIEEIIRDLILIDLVVPDYSLGRSRGLSDEEAEIRVIRAIDLAIEVLEKQTPQMGKV